MFNTNFLILGLFAFGSFGRDIQKRDTIQGLIDLCDDDSDCSEHSYCDYDTEASDIEFIKECICDPGYRNTAPENAEEIQCQAIRPCIDDSSCGLRQSCNSGVCICPSADWEMDEVTGNCTLVGDIDYPIDGIDPSANVSTLKSCMSGDDTGDCCPYNQVYIESETTSGCFSLLDIHEPCNYTEQCDASIKDSICAAKPVAVHPNNRITEYPVLTCQCRAGFVESAPLDPTQPVSVSCLPQPTEPTSTPTIPTTETSSATNSTPISVVTAPPAAAPALVPSDDIRDGTLIILITVLALVLLVASVLIVGVFAWKKFQTRNNQSDRVEGEQQSAYELVPLNPEASNVSSNDILLA